MADPLARIIYDKDGRDPHAFVAASVGEADDDGLVWHPLVFRGAWNHPLSGAFHMGTKETGQMLSNFEAGIPSQGGIPIDEDGMHNQRAEGAWGWIEKLEKRSGNVWGGIRWTPDGEAAVSSGRYRFISAKFETGQRPHPVFGEIGAAIIAGALVTRPFFYGQPELPVAASMFTNDPDAKDPEETSGGNSMETTARERYVAVHGEQTDEQWTGLTQGITTDEGWTAFVEAHCPEGDGEGENQTDELAELRAENERLQAEATATAEAATAAAAAATQTDEERAAVAVAASAAVDARFAAMEGQVTALQTANTNLQNQRTEAEVRGEVAASMFGGHPPTPAAIEVVTAARVNPSRETVDALLAHITENDGRVGTFIAGEVAASVSFPDGATPQEILAGLAYTDDAKAFMANAMAADDKLTLDMAEVLWSDKLNAGTI